MHKHMHMLVADSNAMMRSPFIKNMALQGQEKQSRCGHILATTIKQELLEDAK